MVVAASIHRAILSVGSGGFIPVTGYHDIIGLSMLKPAKNML